MGSSLNFHRYTCLASKLTANPWSHNCPTDMSQRYFMAGRTYMWRSINDNFGIGRGLMFDERIIVAYGCPTHITFRTGVLSVTSTLSPQQSTVHPESMQPPELTCIFLYFSFELLTRYYFPGGCYSGLFFCKKPPLAEATLQEGLLFQCLHKFLFAITGSNMSGATVPESF